MLKQVQHDRDRKIQKAFPKQIQERLFQNTKTKFN